MTPEAWTFASLALVAGFVALVLWWLLRVRSWQLDYVRAELTRQQKAAEAEQAALRRANERDRERALARIQSLRSSNERLRRWQMRVINGHPEAEWHLAEYAREMSDDNRGGEPS